MAHAGDPPSSSAGLAAVPAATATASAGAATTIATSAAAATAMTSAPARRGRRAVRAAALHLAILLGYTAAGIAVTWPHLTYLAGRLPNTTDQASYVWDMWWLARQITHAANPFTTHQIIAPVGAPLGYHALMPLVGLLMVPVTLTAGSVFAVNLLSIVLPGLLCYAMYRAARLWLPAGGALVSGALFGLSSMLTWRAWFHLNIAVGVLCVPIALEAAVALRRDPGRGRAALLGLIIGLSLLVDSEGAILAGIAAAVVLVPWLLAPVIQDTAGAAGAAGILRPLTAPRTARLWLLIVAGLAGLLAASPQLAAMAQQSSALATNPHKLAWSYGYYGVALPQMFAPSPRVAAFGLHGLAAVFYHGITTEGMPTFGVTLTALALLGAVATWRQRHARIWLLLWAAGALLALGPVLYLGTRPYTPLPIHDHGHAMSLLLPYTWFVRLPGMAGFREANRFTPLALIPAALLAGSAVTWIKAKFAPALILVAALAILELGWSVPNPPTAMPANIPAFVPDGLAAVDRAIAADHSGSLVVDVPLGFRSGAGSLGVGFQPEALVLATFDGHPRAVGKISRLPPQTLQAIRRHPFYVDLLRVQKGQAAGAVDPAAIPAARADARRMHVGWVLVWQPVTPQLAYFLQQTGMRPDYRADGVSVYRASGS
jgi:hypothetical protein